MRDFEHILRVAAVFVLVTAGFLAVRAWVKPASYYQFGRFRGAVLAEMKALPIQYAGKSAIKECARCHAAQVKEKAGSSHKGIACETCHGPLAAHIAEPKSVKPVKPSESEAAVFCLRCHAAAVSKPPQFPTVDPKTHNPESGCASCHQPHSPKL